ncbi:hypothetical protein SAY86_028638 [Trapa natans]|uniref:Uncharacterized protein n=1 Tax=Trapa natans TaxID=22666 RepID=A0AAN7MD84_TRANT|nr:hypothetical protein SAY86_028638 [Trapa natans]
MGNSAEKDQAEKVQPCLSSNFIFFVPEVCLSESPKEKRKTFCSRRKHNSGVNPLLGQRTLIICPLRKASAQDIICKQHRVILNMVAINASMKLCKQVSISTETQIS